MDALILSCGTGGGHNAAAKAIKEELVSRGWSAKLLNPYTLCGKNTAGIIDRLYIRLVQRSPKGFGFLYRLGELYRCLPFRSPVYFFNRRAALHVAKYLKVRKFDVVITTHLFPAEIMTWLKSGSTNLPPIIFIATDYACIPFTEETDCDAYVIPAKELTEDFVRRGIPADRIYPFGIPVQASFRKLISCSEAKAELGLEKDADYLLISGGSMGAGKLLSIVKKLRLQCRNEHLIVICGSNDTLFKKLQRKYGDDVILLHNTEQMAEYIRASKIYFTKPGGLSSTEAAVMGTVLVHLPPIPGCETKNAGFFSGYGMSYYLNSVRKGISQALLLADDSLACANMIENQKKMICTNAGAEICNLAQKMAKQYDHKSGMKHEQQYL